MATPLFAVKTATPFDLKCDAKNVAIQYPIFNPFGPRVYWWAERGQVCYWAEPGALAPPVDGGQPDIEYGCLTWDVATKRLIALQEMIVTHGGINYYPEVRRRQEQFCRGLAEVILNAKDQIPPGTDECLKAREAARPKTIILPKRLGALTSTGS